jgi:tetratricopeptide (TPR) repeat protein
MKRNIIKFTVLLICLFIQAQTSFAQMSASGSSQTLPDLGNLNGKAKTLAKPSDPFDVAYGFLSGEVKVKVTVDEKGNVIKAEAVAGDERLRPASVAAAEDSKFEPYLVKGKAVKFSGFLLFNFGASNAGQQKAINDAVNNTNLDFGDLLNSTSYEKYNKGDYTGAIKDATEELKKKPSAEKYELRAKSYFQLKDYDNALKDITLAIEKATEKNLASKYELRGDIFKAEYNYTLAAADYLRVRKLDPENQVVKDKISSLDQKIGDTTPVGIFQRELKASLEEFERLKPDYEKKFAAFNEFLDSEIKKGGKANVLGLCQSLLAIKSDRARLDPIINKTSDKILDLQQKKQFDEYFVKATIELALVSEMIHWSNEKYIPEKVDFDYWFDQLGCKAIEKP